MNLHRHFLRFSVALVALVAGLRLPAVDDEPFKLPVGFSFKVGSGGSGSMDVLDGSSANVSYTYGTLSESPAGTATLKPGQGYTVVFTASGTTNYTISLTAPSGYQFYVDGKPKDFIAVTHGTTSYTDYYEIQLRPQSGEGVMRAGDFTGIDIGQSVSWELGLGTTQAGKTVGRIGFRELDLSTSPATRERLFFTPRYDSEGVNIRWDGPSSTRIRQVVSPRTMIDLVDVTNGYEIRYYNYDDTTYNGYPALYTINSGKTPWHTVFVEAPSGTTNQLRITEKEETTTMRVSHLTLTSGSISSGTYVWTLQEGGSGGAWLRTTTHASTVSGSTRENVVTVREGGTSGTIVSETKYVYKTDYAWGEDVYQVIANPNGGSGTVATTTYDYYTTAPSSGSETHRGNYRRVKSVSNTSGGWTAYEYYDEWEKRGQTKYVYQPFQDSPSSVSLDPTLGRVSYSEYGADSSGRYRLPTLRQEKINNVITGKTVWTYDGSSSSPARVKADVDTFYATGGSSYVRSRSEILDPIQATDLDQAGEPVVVKNPDGTQTSWSRTNGDFDLSTRVFSNAGGSGIYWRILKVTGTSVAGTANGAESSTRNSFDGQGFDALYLVPYKSTLEAVILDYAGLPLRTETRVYTGSGNWSAALATNDSAYDFTRTNRLTGVTAGNGAATAYTYTNGRLTSTVADGLETQFTYDALGRTLTTKKIGASASGIHAAQADITTTYDYDEVDGSNYATKEILSATGTSETIVSVQVFDRAGRVVKVTPPGLSATTVGYNVSARTQTTTAPDGGTSIQETYRDGSLKSTTGTATVPTYYTYSTESDGRKVVQVNSGTSSSTRLQKTWTNWAGQPIKLEKPGFSQSSQSAYVEEQFYSTTTGQLTHSTRTGVAPTRYEYNALGQVKRSGLDVDSGGALVLASMDRIADAETVFELVSTTWWVKTTTTAYPAASSATGVTISVSKQKLNGFSSGVRAESQSTDAEGNTVTSITSVSGILATTQTTVPSLTTDSYAYSYNGRSSASTGHDGLTTKIVYDNLGRQSSATDARSLVTTMAYYTGTALPYTTTDSASNVVSTIAYDTQGRTSWSRDAASKYTRFAYNQRGQVTQQWGDATYPVAYTYDATYGDRTGMSTYRSASAADSTSWPSVGTADTTTWTYDTPSGLLWKKTDAAGEYVAMNYNQAGKTSRRTLARGVYTDYGYDAATGELLTQTYSDGTPTVTYTYTRSGQADSVVDHTGTWDFVYDGSKPWRQASTTLPSFYGTRHYTALYESGGGTMIGRYLGFQIGSSVGSSADLEQVYAYSADGRFDTLTSKRSSNSVTRTFDYSYLTNTPFVSALAITGGHNFTLTRSYESNRNLLASIEGKWGATTVTRYDYAHNALSQRTTAKQSGSAFADYYHTGYSAVFNHYTYNARSELETAAMYRGDTPSTTPSSADELPGRRFEYRFDSIGNRKTDGPTGDAANVDDGYTTNALNQYTTKENNTVRVLGTAAATATVGVTGAPSTGKKDRAWGADFVPTNASTAVAGTANIFAAVVGGGSGGGDLVKSENKAFFIPKGLQTFTYDDDGNLTQDSVWDYTYDAENRLTAMQNRSEVIGTGMISSANARRLEFKYDYQGRRVRKITYGGWNGATYSGTALTDTKYLYDGWNLVAEFNAISTLTLTKIYTWGLDLTGSPTASGGVGGLIQIYDSIASKTLLPTYDGNGNVVSLLNAETGSTLTLEAAYEYDPFGNLLRSEGAYAASNTFRFSTKFADVETGLVYYGLRYYSPTLGRFINKDPIEEQGGLNLYAFVRNNSINRWDYLGMLEPNVIAALKNENHLIPAGNIHTSPPSWTSEWYAWSQTPAGKGYNGLFPYIGVAAINGKPTKGPDGARLDPNAYKLPTGQWISGMSVMVNKKWETTWHVFNINTAKWEPYVRPPTPPPFFDVSIAGSIDVADGVGLSANGSTPTNEPGGELNVDAIAGAGATANVGLEFTHAIPGAPDPDLSTTIRGGAFVVGGVTLDFDLQSSSSETGSPTIDATLTGWSIFVGVGAGGIGKVEAEGSTNLIGVEVDKNGEIIKKKFGKKSGPVRGGPEK